MLAMDEKLLSSSKELDLAYNHNSRNLTECPCIIAPNKRQQMCRRQQQLQQQRRRQRWQGRTHRRFSVKAIIRCLSWTCLNILIHPSIVILVVQPFPIKTAIVSTVGTRPSLPHNKHSTLQGQNMNRGRRPVSINTFNYNTYIPPFYSKHRLFSELVTKDTACSSPSEATIDNSAWPYSEFCSANDPTCINLNPKPQTKQIMTSIRFFIHYLSSYMKLKSGKNKKKKRRRGRWRSMRVEEFEKNTDLDVASDTTHDAATHEDTPLEQEQEEIQSMSFRQTMHQLNEARKNVIQLCGYDKNLVQPSFTFLLLGALFESISPSYWSRCITLVVQREPSQMKIIRALTGLTITSLMGALCTGLRGALFWVAGSRGNYNVRVKLHRNLLRQEAAFFDGTETGVLISRINNDVNKIGMVVSFHVNVVLRQMAQFLIGSVFLIKVSPRLSVWAFAGILLVGYVSAVYGSFARSLAEKVQGKQAKASAVAETSFSMSETIRAFNGIPTETGRYEDAQSRTLELEEVQAWAYGTHKVVSDVLQYALQGSLLFACWSLGRSGKIPAAQLTSFLFYVHYVLESSNEVGDQWAKIQSAVGASSKVFELVRRIPTINDAEKPGESRSLSPAFEAKPVGTDIDGLVSGKGLVLEDHQVKEPIISMKNVTIIYEGTDSPALNNVTMDVLPGDRVAIVGRSGSGKSSMLRSILRFYDPANGTCAVRGVDLKHLSRNEISNVVSIVQQEPELFPITLAENVLYGTEKDGVDERTGLTTYSEKYRKSAVQALDFAGLPVEGLKNDLGLCLSTRVGEGGRTLSGGQRQRVAVARALVRSPDVLLLDEPTAALDSKSEKLVIKALNRAMEKTRCMVLVTHRLNVIRALGVNKVIVLEEGEIAEVGHPEALLRQGGTYAQLASEQGIRPQQTDSESGGENGLIRWNHAGHATMKGPPM